MKFIVDILNLLRIRQWTKNILVLVPAFFAGIISTDNMGRLGLGLLAFCLTAGLVYIVNDWRDKEADAKHPKKKFRPIPMGKFTAKDLLFLSSALILVLLICLTFLPVYFGMALMSFLILNLCYSLGLKKVPYLEILIVASGFVLRIYGGGFLADVPISKWLVLLIAFTALLIITAKRKSELEIENAQEVRKVLKYYSLKTFNFIIVGLSLASLAVYCAYCLDDAVTERIGSSKLIYTCIPISIGMLRYLYQIFVKKNTGSPAELFYKDKFMFAIILLWLSAFYYFLYVG